MKVDKEFLLTHRFWIMLGVSVPLALGAILVLLTGVSAQIAAHRKALEKELGASKKPAPEVVNQANIDQAEALLKEAFDKQALVWSSAYDGQKHLFRWPEEIEREFQFDNGFFALVVDMKKELPGGEKGWPDDKPGELIHGKLVRKDAETFDIVGRGKKLTRFHRTEKIQIIDNDRKPVFFPDFDVAKHGGDILCAVTYQKGHYFNDKLTQSEQGKFATAAYTNQIPPILETVQPLQADGKGVVQLKNWLYEPGVLPGGGKSFIHYYPGNWDLSKDISEEAWIAQEEIWLQRDIYSRIKVANEAVGNFEGKGGSKAGTYTFTNPYFVLEAKWPPVKDQLEVKLTNRLGRRQKLDQKFIFHFEGGKVSEPLNFKGEPLEPRGAANDSRTDHLTLRGVTAPKQLVSVEQQLTWESAAVKRIDAIIIGDELAQSQRTFSIPLRAFTEEAPKEEKEEKKGVGGRRGQARLGQLTTHGFRKDRYLEVTPQARRVPVSITLIVEQDHIDRIMTAFDNSPLRFLTTQVLLNHYPQSLRPRLAGGNAKEEANTSSELESNIEMVLYGIMTMYERYPPRPMLEAKAEQK